MIYTIATLFLFATIIALRYKGRKSLLLAAMVLLLDITIFSVVLYVSKCGNYPYPNSSFMTLDYKGYMILSRIRIPFYSVIRMQNRGLAGFLFCMPFILNLIRVDRKWKWLDYVLVNELGDLILPNCITATFNRMVEKKGLKDVRFHDLRHTCASLLLNHGKFNGVGMEDIQVWLGHSDFATTANIYSHVDASSKQASMETISGLVNI